MKVDDDSLFFKRLQDGEESAYHELIDRMTKPLFNIAYKILKDTEDSNDAVMAAYESLFQNRSLLQYPKGVEAWLRITASRKAYDIIRANKRLIFMDNDAIEDTEVAAVEANYPQDDVIAEKFEVHDCLNRLTQAQRDVLFLKVCGYPNRLVTKITGLTTARVKLAYKKAQEIFIDYYKAIDKYPYDKNGSKPHGDKAK